LALAGLTVLLPAMNILPLELVGGAFIAERYLALPFALFTLSICAFLARSEVSLRHLLGVAAVWICACVVMIELTLPHWHDDLSLWTWGALRAPSSDVPHIALSSYYVDRGDDARALAEANAAIERNPAAVKAWNNRGVALFNEGQVAEAQAAWEQTTRLTPEHALAWSNLANALAVQGQLDEAERILVDQALRLDPDLPLGLFTLGELYIATDRPALAIPQLERALRVVPPNQRPAVLESLERARAAARSAQ